MTTILPLTSLTGSDPTLMTTSRFSAPESLRRAMDGIGNE